MDSSKLKAKIEAGETQVVEAGKVAESKFITVWDNYTGVLVAVFIGSFIVGAVLGHFIR